MTPDDSADRRGAERRTPSERRTLFERRTLAARWGNWAANLLVSGVLVVVGLVFGREVLQWWYVDSPSPPGRIRSGDSPTPSMMESDAEFQFGDWPLVFRHGVAAADLPAALEQLKQECARTALDASSAGAPPGPAESRLLAELAPETADLELPGGGRLYLRTRPLPMAVAVNGGRAGRERRVLAWGILFPSRGVAEDGGDGTGAESGWSWYTWRTADGRGADGDGAGEKLEASADFPELPGGRRLLAIRLPSGETRVGYAGTATGRRWRDACQAWYVGRGWRLDGAWETAARAWSGRFQHDDPPRRAEILIRAEPSGQIQAFLNVSPTAATK